MDTAPWATFMQKAIQVGLPHSLQFFLGDSLKMSRPFKAIIWFLLPNQTNSEMNFRMVATAAGCRMMTASAPPVRLAAAVEISIAMPRSS